MENARIKVLLIEDDEDDYIVFTKLLTGISQKRFGLKWASNYEAAFKTAGEEPFDVVLSIMFWDKKMDWPLCASFFATV